MPAIRRNAERLVATLRQFGFTSAELNQDLFLKRDSIIRMGSPPFRIELFTSLSGVEFDACYGNRISAIIDEAPVDLISLSDLRANKLASGRTKDLVDLEHLP